MKGRTTWAGTWRMVSVGGKRLGTDASVSPGLTGVSERVHCTGTHHAQLSAGAHIPRMDATATVTDIRLSPSSSLLPINLVLDSS